LRCWLVRWCCWRVRGGGAGGRGGVVAQHLVDLTGGEVVTVLVPGVGWALSRSCWEWSGGAGCCSSPTCVWLGGGLSGGAGLMPSIEARLSSPVARVRATVRGRLRRLEDFRGARRRWQRQVWLVWVAVVVPVWFGLTRWCGLSELPRRHSGGCKHVGLL
jgi:hypothetical protein